MKINKTELLIRSLSATKTNNAIGLTSGFGKRPGVAQLL